MLFRGSHKYPEVDLFVDMIKKSKGEFNAYTSGDETNYFFGSS
jgi:secreted Zn-dependent insulinase-like peptidase